MDPDAGTRLGTSVAGPLEKLSSLRHLFTKCLKAVMKILDVFFSALLCICFSLSNYLLAKQKPCLLA